MGAILGISGNVTRPSRTSALVAAVLEALSAAGDTVHLDLHDQGAGLLKALRRNQADAGTEALIRTVEAADILVVGTPVYRASYSGVFKHLFDLVHYDALKDKIVLLAATGGTDRHALVIEHQLRPLFGFFGAVTVPTGIYATEGDFRDYALTSPDVKARIDLAVRQALALAAARPAAVPAAA